MERDEIERMIYRVLATEDEEINCEQLFELIARYVDMEAAGEDAPSLLPMVHQHLEQCDACAELHDTLHELALMERHGEFPETEELLDDIVAAEPAPAPGPAVGAAIAPRLSSRSRNSGERSTLPEDEAVSVRRDEPGRLLDAVLQPARWLRWNWIATAAALVLVVFVGVWGWQQSRVAAEMQRDAVFIARADRAIWMQGTVQDPDARGYLFIDEGERRGLLVIDGLNALPQDQVYQMWLMFDSTDSVSLGTFTVGTDERGLVWVDFGDRLAQFTRLAITPEPQGGSTHPTTSPVCVWGKQTS